MSAIKQRNSQYTEEQLRKMKRKEITTGLSDREIAFCENYIQDYNPTMAALKAGYKLDKQKTSIIGKLRNKQSVIDYTAWLKLKLYDKAMISAEDVFNMYAKLSFYDVTDYMKQDKDGSVTLKNFEEIDGQIIQEIRQDNNGNVTIKFPDRLKSMERLEKYMDSNPYDWNRKVEEEKLKILQERLFIDKFKAGMEEEMEDDGFIQALNDAIKNINFKTVLYKGEEN